MDEINLDFFKPPPRTDQSNRQAVSPFVYSEFDFKFSKKKGGSKALKIAQTIAKVDELVQEIDKLKSQNCILQQQLKDFKMTAEQVQDLYIEEKNRHSMVKNKFNKLQTEYSEIDVNFTNMTMVNEQMKARLAEYDGRPIKFNNLVIKYVKIMDKLEGDDILKYNCDKDLVERLRDYCASMNIKIKPANSPKKSKLRGSKIKTLDSFVQCDLLQKSDYPINKPQMKDQTTQCVTTIKSDQACQYISTMITRQTNTEKIVQKHVQTMFPETPAIDDIIKSFSRWSNIRSISPLLESPSCISNTRAASREILKKSLNAGTCTMLCNIRRKIDYLPVNNSSNIKQEIFTPSVSPTPTLCATTKRRTRANSIVSNVPCNINPSSILDLLNSNTNSSLGQLSSTAFNELWQIFGKMLLSLLQISNTGITNTNQTSTFNQQQFLDWLRELYINSHTETASTVETQTLEQPADHLDSNVSTSPLHFNEASMLLTDVVRPQPQKTWTAGTNVREEGISLPLSSNTFDNSTSATPVDNALNVPINSLTQASNSIELRQTQVTSNSTELQTTINNLESNPHEINKITNKSIPNAKILKHHKSKHNVLDEVRKLLPEINLNKKKLKVLNKLLKNNNHRKKKFEAGKSEIFNRIHKESSPSDVILANENSNNDNEVETAVDFLKTFAVTQKANQPLEESFSETEKIFLKQISSENIQNNDRNDFKSNEFTFIKPANSLPQHVSNSCGDTRLKPQQKSKTSKSSKQIENKYQLLFGDSDSELEDQEIEIKNAKTNVKPVIKSTVNLNMASNKCNINNYNKTAKDLLILNSNKDYASQQLVYSTNSNQLTNLYHATSKNITLQNSSTNIKMPIYENDCSNISSQEKLILKDFESIKSRANDSRYIDLHANEESICPGVQNFLAKDLELSSEEENVSISAKLNYCLADVQNFLENDLELSSDDCSVKDHEGVTNLSNISKTDDKLTKGDVGLNQINDFNDINSHTEQDNKNLNTDLFEEQVTSMPTLKDSLSETDSLAVIEKRVQSLPISVESHHVGEEPMYSSDVGKDLELSSSDEESLIMENCSKKEIEPDEVRSLEKQQLTFTTNQNYGPSKQNCNRLTNSREANLSEHNSIAIIALENEKDICNSKKDDEESNSNILGTDFLLNFEFDTEYCKQRKTEINSTLNYKSEQKISSLNNCNESVDLFSTIILSESTLKDNQMRNESHKTNENLEYSKYSENVDNNLSTNSLNKNRLEHILSEWTSTSTKSDNLLENGEDNKILFERASKSSSSKLTEMHPTENQSINLSNIDEHSVITVTDSTINKETFNSKESKCGNTAAHKISGLKTLKLLVLDNKPNHKKLFYDSVINKKIDIPNNLNKTEINKNFINAEVPTTINTKQNISPYKSTNKAPIYQQSEANAEINMEVAESYGRKECLLIEPIYADTFNMEQINNIEVITSKNINSYKSLNALDESEFNDSLSVENELIIDEDEINEKNICTHFEADPLNISTTSAVSVEDIDDTTNSSNISTLLNSNLYKDDLLKEEMLVAADIATYENKPKRGRKRKSECLTDLQHCKRSQRLKDKQMMLEKSNSHYETSTEFLSYTKAQNSTLNNNEQLKSPIKQNIKKKNSETKCETIQNSKSIENENMLQMGFFIERDVAAEVTPENNKTFAAIEVLKPEVNETEKPCKHETRRQLPPEREQLNMCSQQKEEKQSLAIECEQDFRISENQKNIKILESFIYTDSPQSPAPTETNNEEFVNIPTERLPQFAPQQNIPKLFDILINSYKNENQKQVLEKNSAKECKLQQNILNQFEIELKLYCYNDMELDLYCTSTRVINKLLSISPDYNLMQKALITIAQNAEKTNVPENELPSIIQEMPPRHLSKCMQRLFVFLKNVVTRNSNFCQDLINQIEILLFNSKKFGKSSSQDILNLTQVFLMCCKIQEYLQIPKLPARLFIAKCLYFFVHGSSLIIHEVLMWYPTVLPHREDKTYDRSDALISVIQNILMSTKYDMDNTNSDLRGRIFLSKLRYEYHFEPFKPLITDVINVLVEKLKSSKFYNLSLAFGLLCKRIGSITTHRNVLNEHLLPLANEYYSLALKTNEYDERISVLLEIISILVKHLTIETDIQIYFNELARFLNGFERQRIQEAALCSILRLQRFNVKYCYNLLRHFQPTYDLNTHTQAMLKTFLYRSSLTFWKNLSQNAIKFN